MNRRHRHFFAPLLLAASVLIPSAAQAGGEQASSGYSRVLAHYQLPYRLLFPPGTDAKYSNGVLPSTGALPLFDRDLGPHWRLG